MKILSNTTKHIPEPHYCILCGSCASSKLQIIMIYEMIRIFAFIFQRYFYILLSANDPRYIEFLNITRNNLEVQNPPIMDIKFP